MTAEQIALLLNYGVLGLVVLGFLTGQIHPKSRVDREEEISNKALDAAEKTIASLDRLTQSIEEWRRIERRKDPR